MLILATLWKSEIRQRPPESHGPSRAFGLQKFLNICTRLPTNPFCTFQTFLIELPEREKKQASQSYVKDHILSVHLNCSDTKGQLISKCPFGVIIWTKIPTKKFDNICPRI